MYGSNNNSHIYVSIRKSRKRKQKEKRRRRNKKTKIRFKERIDYLEERGGRRTQNIFQPCWICPENKQSICIDFPFPSYPKYETVPFVFFFTHCHFFFQSLAFHKYGLNFFFSRFFIARKKSCFLHETSSHSFFVKYLLFRLDIFSKIYILIFKIHLETKTYDEKIITLLYPINVHNLLHDILFLLIIKKITLISFHESIFNKFWKAYVFNNIFQYSIEK